MNHFYFGGREDDIDIQTYLQRDYHRGRRQCYSSHRRASVISSSCPRGVPFTRSAWRLSFFLSSSLTEPQITLDSIAGRLRYPDTMTESNSSIDSSFIFVGTEQSQVLPPSRPPTVTSDATFPSSISTPTSPIDSNASCVGTLEVRNHTTSPFTRV